MTEHVLILRQWRLLRACVLMLCTSVLLAGAARDSSRAMTMASLLRSNQERGLEFRLKA